MFQSFNRCARFKPLKRLTRIHSSAARSPLGVWLCRESNASSAAKRRIAQLNRSMKRIRLPEQSEAYDGDLGSESELPSLQTLSAETKILKRRRFRESGSKSPSGKITARRQTSLGCSASSPVPRRTLPRLANRKPETFFRAVFIAYSRSQKLSAIRYSFLVHGCGAFGNDPHRTAFDFRQPLENDFRGTFSDVVFAITD